MKFIDALCIVAVTLFAIAVTVAVGFALDKSAHANESKSVAPGLCIDGMLYESVRQGDRHFWIVRDRGDGAGPARCGAELIP